MKSYQAFFWSQWYETRIQLQEESWKNHKYVENEQHGTKQLLGQQRNQRRKQKFSEDKWKWKYHIPNSVGCIKSDTKREVYSNTGIYQDTRKISNKQSDLTPKETREEQMKLKISRRKEVIKSRVEINGN